METVDWNVHMQFYFWWYTSVWTFFFPLIILGLFICVQARAVSGICGMLHVCSSEDATQPVYRTHQNTRGLHLQTQLEHGQRAAQPYACHDLP